MKTDKFKCNVPHGWCEALNIQGDCGHYSDGICHMWLEPRVERRIQSCDHRKRMNKLEKAFKRDCKYVDKGGEPADLYGEWLRQTEAKSDT